MGEKAEEGGEAKLGLAYAKSDFSEWYNDVALKSDLVDFSEVKGFMFIKPYGYAVWEKIHQVLDAKLKASGHVNAYAPALIPEKLLNKEKDHVKGFAPEGFVVTEAGTGKLAEKLVLRPTSETVIHASYAKWIRSWRDLPVLWNYWNSVFRSEIKMTKLFIRTCEFLWQEGHTVHATEAEAKAEVQQIAEFYRQLMEEELAVPVMVGKKTDKEKFAGAVETVSLEALMPDGKALQMGTSHNLGQNFAKAFGITYLDEKQTRKHAWQTSWGVSTRLIGAVIMVHGDDKGLVLPPRVAPIQVVIVPIVYDKSRDAVIKKAKGIASKLSSVSVKLDDREGYTPGWKFNEWELKGVPLRMEIGPKDVEKGQVVLVRRDTGEKAFVADNDIEKAVPATLEKIQQSLLAKAKQFLASSTVEAATYDALKKAIAQKRIVSAGWCGNAACEDKLQTETSATIRIIPFDAKAIHSCICCGKKANHSVLIAKCY